MGSSQVTFNSSLTQKYMWSLVNWRTTTCIIILLQYVITMAPMLCLLLNYSTRDVCTKHERSVECYEISLTWDSMGKWIPYCLSQTLQIKLDRANTVHEWSFHVFFGVDWQSKWPSPQGAFWQRTLWECEKSLFLGKCAIDERYSGEPLLM